jgi:hypothetical protein
VTGFPNTILGVDESFVYVRTNDTDMEKYPNGDRIPIEWVQEGGDKLFADGVVVLERDVSRFRSAFIGAVLLTLPDTIGRRVPARVELTTSATLPAAPQLEPDRIYRWDELADVFGFKPGYFSVAGGMVPSKATESLLLITHPGGGESFDYGDYWDGENLIYTGKGKVGDQERSGQNLDVAENRRTLFVFEAAGPQRLRYLGRARNIEERTARAPDDDGDMRDVSGSGWSSTKARCSRPAHPRARRPEGDGRDLDRSILSVRLHARPSHEVSARTQRRPPRSRSRQTSVTTRYWSPSTATSPRGGAPTSRTCIARSTSGRHARAACV